MKIDGGTNLCLGFLFWRDASWSFCGQVLGRQGHPPQADTYRGKGPFRKRWPPCGGRRQGQMTQETSTTAVGSLPITLPPTNSSPGRVDTDSSFNSSRWSGGMTLTTTIIILPFVL